MLMEPKRHILWVLLSLIGWYSPAQARDSVNVKSAVKEATLFFEGAHLTRNGSVNLTVGEHLLIFDDLPYGIELSSIQFKPLNGMEVKSVRPVQYQVKSKSKEELAIDDQLEALDVQAKRLQLQIGVLQSERKVIEKNTAISPSKLSVDELKSLSSFYSGRINQIEAEIIDLKLKLLDLKDEAKSLLEKMNELSAKRLVSGSKVFVDVQCKKSVRGDVKLSYFSDAAGWMPKYDFHVHSISQPMKIKHKADVYQNTGEDWNKIKLKVSNTDPKSSQSIPQEKVWRLDRKYPYETADKGPSGVGSISGYVRDLHTQDPLPFANVVVKQNDKFISGGTTDIDGMYLIKPLDNGVYSVEISTIGMQTAVVNGVKIKANDKTNLDVELITKAEMLQEFAVVEYKVPLFEKDQTVSGSTFSSNDIRHTPTRSASGVSSSSNVRGARSDVNYYFVDGIKIQNNQLNALAATSNITHIEYELKEPYSLQSDGLNSEIELLESVVEAEYVYHVYPSINNEAYLIANIPEFGQLNLLKAEASIYYESAYVGKTEISPSIVKDTLELSVGKDSKIVAHKEINKEFNQQIFLKKGYRKELGWSVSVKNEHAEAINLVIHDQIPISKSSNIEIELVELSGGEPDEKGLIEWKENLASGQSIEKKLLISAKVSTN